MIGFDPQQERVRQIRIMTVFNPRQERVRQLQIMMGLDLNGKLPYNEDNDYVGPPTGKTRDR